MATSKEFDRKKTMPDEEMVQRVIELFGSMLDLEIIQSVALNCNYDMETTSNILFEISSSIGAVPKQPKQQQGKKNKQNDAKQMNSYATATSNHNSKDADVIVVSEKVVNCSPNKMDLNLYSVPSQKKGQPLAPPQRKSKKEQEFDRVVLHVRQGTRILILMRGLPGSGKSYLAKEIVDKAIGCSDYFSFIFSADDYFLNRRTGRYEYDPIKLSNAHEWNQQRAYKAMSTFISPVIIDNTNLQAWEMRTYVMMAVNFGYSIEIVEPFTHWAFNDKELARKNSHGVPKAKIKEMIERYEKNITPNKLLTLWSLSYSLYSKPPLNRSYPPIQHNAMPHNGVAEAAVSNSFAILPLINNGNNALMAGYKNNEIKKTKSAKLKENVDLMDFESDLSSPQSVHVCDNDDKTKLEVNPFDSILTHTPTSNIDILKPNVWSSEKHLISNANPSEPEMKKIRTYSNFATNDATIKSSPEESQNGLIPQPTPQQISQARNLYPKLNLSSWGLSENAISSWESWDVVRPLNCPKELEKTDFEQQNLNTSTFMQTAESTTNTSSADFALLSKDSASQGIKLLKAKNRNINEGVAVAPPMSPPKRILLDKSSMTNEDVLSAAVARERDANDEKQVQELVSLFPDIPVDYLRDVYEKCKKDLNWAVDLLLDDNKELLPSENMQPNNPVETLPTHNENESLQVNMEALKIASERKQSNGHEKKEEVEEIKRYLEENIEINNDYYSEHILKIKNQRHHGLVNKPSTSKASNFDAHYTSSGEVLAVNSDVDFDNFEPDIEFPENEEEEMMELNLGECVVSQLETKFGFPEMFPQGFLPVVHVPVSLARQLYALYVESVLVQMENQNQVLEMIVKEDQEFAKKLQMQEEQVGRAREGRKTPDLQEIMDEQVASNLYQKETEEWKKLTPDNLAARLTRQKLYKTFPTIDEMSLMEILHAHNNSYKDTIEVLLASTEHDKIYDPDGNIREPPISETVVDDMKRAEEETRESVNTPDTRKSANEYREEASNHLQKHKELIQRAQQAYQSRQFQVAQFYSDLAKTHTQLYDQANNLAASAFLQEHSQRLQNFSTLDLHYLYVKEAIAALDMFIDTNIQLLQGTHKKCENLFVITGRGKRSEQGRSRIKPAVMARLRKRDIWYVEVNPGLLKIRVRPHSAITSSIP